MESKITNGCHTLRNRDGGQAGAVIEGIITDATHAFWNDDRGQAGAAVEGIFPNARHARREGKAFLPILVNCEPSAKLTDVRSLQLRNTPGSIVATT